MSLDPPAKGIASLQQALADFAQRRDWHRFHSPKNLAMALSVEAAEIMELFQWVDTAGSGAIPLDKQQALAEEIGDVMIYLTMLASKFNIDPVDAAWAKMALNEKKYPANQVYGKSLKYNEY
ncbi:MAG: nucleotide pyrophosphohydrolase [Magnetococcales bacterium]|nr:nucleotide pyrophosphohydrolase [Magnetococcales bacterium]MBF0151146.1 nucleotide pyrophosphohydrolase [Magnetococcales bacterium]MBF0172540.1 nucleotide pyrophosphohydrolase [Magnetococcales bacterium]MBF0347066.1 nucleotide pyrophosphohydrolase [Magnetococcales bacterium]MBF0629993.1 nucleotide pyrophosphohydrolase [Magnetococcales bacterium]